MPERMTVSTVRRAVVNDGNGNGNGRDVFFPSSRPILLKEIISGEQMVSPYTLLTPPDVGSAPTTAASIQQKSNQLHTSHFFPTTTPTTTTTTQPPTTTDYITGTSIPYPTTISSSLLNAGCGFTFVTNYNSDKSIQITSFTNNDLTLGAGASLTFHWVELERVVRIEGLIYRGPESLSDLYHSQRPRGSQISALASKQSQPLLSHDDIVNNYNHIDELLKAGRYGEIESVNINRPGKLPLNPPHLPNNPGVIDPNWVPRPDQWGAFVVIPERFEFWQGKPSRFHERVIYTPKNVSSVVGSGEKVEWEMNMVQP